MKLIAGGARRMTQRTFKVVLIKPSHYDDDGYVRYDLLARSDSFVTAIERLRQASERRQIALVCSEADPARCHRHLLVARALVDAGMPNDRVVHLLSHGSQLPESAIPSQLGLLEDVQAWKSPQSVLHKVQPRISSDV